MGKKIFLISAVLVCAAFFCKKRPEAKKETAGGAVVFIDTKISGLPLLPIPADNLESPAKVALGERLYNDKRLSRDGEVSCATCHDPKKAFTDNLRVSRGFQNKKGARNAPTVINAAFYKEQFWDGRRPSLEAQSKDPLLNPVEHALKSHDEVVEIIRGDESYVKEFQSVFGMEPGGITIDHFAKAVAAFERTVVSGDSPFDRFRYGGDQNAISAAAKRGLALYLGKARCQECHTIGETSALFFDNKHHNLGVGFDVIEDRLSEIVELYNSGQSEKLTAREKSELGRYVVTKNSEDIGAFKTPTLRNIVLTGPYMHDGSIKTLKEVIELYNRGGNENPFLSSGIRPLKLTPREIGDLVEFLKTLTSDSFQREAQTK